MTKSGVEKGGLIIMVDTNSLKGVIAKNGLSQSGVARLLGVTPNTFYGKMKKGIFDSDEIEIMIRELSIENPIEIFFAQDVTR